ncbi:MAG: hypothetical protein GY855_02760 [candidate division Zixibacteria bacterium]|nr:hypothetical protein [candidate division Zixibacteria bacterium]
MRKIIKTSEEMNDLKAPETLEEDVLNAIERYESEKKKQKADKLKGWTQPKWAFGLSLGTSAAIIFLGFMFSSRFFQPAVNLSQTGVEVSTSASETDFNKADLVIDNPGEIIRIVQDLQADRYIIAKSSDRFSKSPEDLKAVDTIYFTQPPFQSTENNSNIVKTGAEIIF